MQFQQFKLNYPARKRRKSRNNIKRTVESPESRVEGTRPFAIKEHALNHQENPYLMSIILYAMRTLLANYKATGRRKSTRLYQEISCGMRYAQPSHKLEDP